MDLNPKIICRAKRKIFVDNASKRWGWLIEKINNYLPYSKENTIDIILYSPNTESSLIYSLFRVWTIKEDGNLFIDLKKSIVPIIKEENLSILDFFVKFNIENPSNIILPLWMIVSYHKDTFGVDPEYLKESDILWEFYSESDRRSVPDNREWENSSDITLKKDLYSLINDGKFTSFTFTSNHKKYSLLLKELDGGFIKYLVEDLFKDGWGWKMFNGDWKKYLREV